MKPTPDRRSSKKPVASAESTATIRGALEQLILDVLPNAKSLQVGNAATFYSIDRDTRTVCGIKIRNGEVGLHLPAFGTYDDPDRRLVGKGPAGRTLWLRSTADVPSARSFIERALAFARS